MAETDGYESAAERFNDPFRITPWSNLFSNVPLTSENLRAVWDKMSGMIGIACQPNRMVIPHALWIDWLHLCVSDAQRAVDKCKHRISRGILTGHYQKRRRQINQGIARLRLQKRAHAIELLPGLLGALANAQRNLAEAIAESAASAESASYAFFEPNRPMFDNGAGE